MKKTKLKNERRKFSYMNRAIVSIKINGFLLFIDPVFDPGGEGNRLQNYILYYLMTCRGG